MEKNSTHKRRSIRYSGYDYSKSGSYFVTIDTHLRKVIFGRIIDDEMQLNRFGYIAREQWFRTVELRSEVILFEDEFVVMPNHIHGIIHIDNPGISVGAQRRCAPTNSTNGPVCAAHSLGAIVRAYKAAVTYAIHASTNSSHEPVWQRNYYEHIIADERDYLNISEYIALNPAKWHEDTEYQVDDPNSTIWQE
jgi:REP element-mobilizing transposase RayT